MTLENIRNEINNHIGNNVKVIFFGARNKTEEFVGLITEAYNQIFIIELNNKEKKSVCYSDVLTETVKIYYQ